MSNEKSRSDGSPRPAGAGRSGAAKKPAHGGRLTGRSPAPKVVLEPQARKENERLNLRAIRREVELVRRAIENPVGAKFMLEVFEAAVEAAECANSGTSRKPKTRHCEETYFVC